MTREQRVELMAERYSRYEDIWTGEPLSAETVKELQREDELSRLRSDAASNRIE